MDLLKELNRAKYRAFYWRQRFLADDNDAIALYKFQEAAAEIVAIKGEWRQLQKDTWHKIPSQPSQPSSPKPETIFSIDFL